MASLCSDRAARVKPTFGFNVGFASCFGRSVRSDVNPFPVDLYARPISRSAAICRHAKNSDPVCHHGASAVLHIGPHVDAAKIGPPVVCRVAVNVVYDAFRPFAHDKRPDGAMGEHAATINDDVPVEVRPGSGRGTASVSARPVTPIGKRTGERIVEKQVAKPRWANIKFSHEALQLLIGQRPARSSKTRWPRHCGVAAADRQQKGTTWLR